MAFWIYMLVMSALTPLTILLFGLYFRSHAPKKINLVFGYRTEMSMKNRDTWIFAHRYCGRIWVWGGAVQLPLVLLSMVLTYGKSENTVGFVGALWMLMPLVVITVSIICTEHALKRNFDRFGRPRE